MASSISAYIPLLALLITPAFVDISSGADYSVPPDGRIWDGIYRTEVSSDINATWGAPDVLEVTWGKEVRYGGRPIAAAKFINTTAISWAEDPAFGSGQIEFLYGDNRSDYWPEGAEEGRTFTGWMQPLGGKAVELRGSNGTSACPAPGCDDEGAACSPACTHGKSCIDGRCACPKGTTDCSGWCLQTEPCQGCDNGKVCLNGKCVCPIGTKDCNGRCISLSECCGGCPAWKACINGSCACPPGVKDCSDPLG